MVSTIPAASEKTKFWKNPPSWLDLTALRIERSFAPLRALAPQGTYYRAPQGKISILFKKSSLQEQTHSQTVECYKIGG